jgi:hypothetical protein
MWRPDLTSGKAPSRAREMPGTETRGPLRENALDPFPVEDTIREEQRQPHLPCGISLRKAEASSSLGPLFDDLFHSYSTLLAPARMLKPRSVAGRRQIVASATHLSDDERYHSSAGSEYSDQFSGCTISL